jgi:ligand-binding sensor domain-containing protein/signal transduction histidine kinase
MVKASITIFVFLIGLAGVLSSTAVGQRPLVFEHLTVENGLSSGSVLSLAQDHKGFIWVGTTDGLNRYDGARIKVYKSFYRDNAIAQSITVQALLADSSNKLWIGTNNGLYIYDTRLDSFVMHKVLPEIVELPGNSVKALLQDKAGNIWIGTRNGLVRSLPGRPLEMGTIIMGYKKDSSCSVQAIFENSDGVIFVGTDRGIVTVAGPQNRLEEFSTIANKLSGLSITTIAEDSNKNLWLGTFASGIFKVDRNFTSVDQYSYDVKKENGLLSNRIRKLLVDKSNRLWIGTLKGLNLFDPVTGKFQAYIHVPGNPTTLNYNSIYDIREDKQGNILVGTYFGGVNIAENLATKFTAYQNSENPASISSDVISGVVSDKYNNLWIGTEAEGMNYFDRRTKTFKRFRNDADNPSSLSSNLVKTVIRDNSDNIWVGTQYGGIDVISNEGRTIKHLTTRTTNNQLVSNDVISLLLDHSGKIWIGYVDDGVSVFDPQSQTFQKFDALFPGAKLCFYTITYLFEDSKHNIWVGTRHGLNQVQLSQRKVNFFQKGYAQGQIVSDYINCIAEDNEGHVWVGTNYGLNCYDSTKNKFRIFTTADGLSGNKVQGILTDSRNNLWISTDNGLCKLDSTRRHFFTYTTYDGLPGKVFNTNSNYKDANGHLYFGTFNGLVEFDPADIQTNQVAPSVILTRLSIHGTPVHVRDSLQVLTQDISETNEIILSYDQNVISVDYAVLNFIKPNKNRSAYKLEGYNQDWIATESQTASFTNLPPGDYRLLIKGANNDGIWNNTPRMLKLTILPPPWKTWWAYATYVITLLLIFYGVLYFLNSRTELRRKLHYEHMNSKRQEELHQMKMDFFTHVSHEIRTPLTLIVTPVDMMLDMTTDQPMLQKVLQNIKKHSSRLLKLTNDLMDFRKADSGYTQLKIGSNELVGFCKSIFTKFVLAASDRHIDFTFNSTEEQLEAWFDADHMEIVITNLLSNALKFTPDGGSIILSIRKPQPDAAEISVCDNGIGIPDENQEMLFSNFYQVDSRGNKKAGSGIGLAFSKSLVELHQGKMYFQSGIKQETGKPETCFFVLLKLGKQHFTEANTLVE